MLKESKDPKIIWKCIHSLPKIIRKCIHSLPKIIRKCIHSLNSSNHIRPHRLVTENDLKVDNSIDIANTFNKFFTSCVENLRSENISTSTNFSKLLNFVNNKISQNTQFAIPPVKMNELLQDLLNLDIKHKVQTCALPICLLKVFAISIDLSTFRSFSVTSLWGLIWFDVFRLCLHFHISLGSLDSFNMLL